MSQHLYHGTGVYALASILEEDRLLEGIYWGKKGEPHGPRFSRNFKTAQAFIEYNLYWLGGGVLVFDRERLAQSFQLVSYRDSSYSGELMPEEDEVAAITPSIAPISDFLVSLVFDPSIIEQACDPESLKTAKEECGWAFDHEDDARATQAIQALAEHPLLNA